MGYVRSKMAGMEPLIERPTGTGVQRLYRFRNGYGASVIKGTYTYGGPQGCWELAVLSWPEATDSADGWELTYDTPITSDVVGWLSEDDVQELLHRVKALPDNPKMAA